MPTRQGLLRLISAGCAHRRLLERARSGGLDSRGNTLVGVMAVITAVLLVGSAIFILGNSEGDIVEYAVDDARAFYVAEGGLERARAWLGALQENDPNADPVGVVFQDQALGGGRYTAEIRDDVPGSWITAYEVVSTGEMDGAVRQVKAVLIGETFARYQWFVERGGWKWFQTGERFEGPVHTNFAIQIDGDPWFGGRVTSAGNVLTIKQGSDPTFMRGYELNVESIPLPGADYLSDLQTRALNGGLPVPALPGSDNFYTVEFGPTAGQMTYTGLHVKKNGTVKVVDGPHTTELAGLNGAIWFDDTIAAKGTLDGQVTLGSGGNIEIWDDIIYEDSTPGSGPNPGCDDVLGLIATRDIVISYTPENQHDCEVHGVLMALEKNIEAEDYMHHAPRGTFVIYGGMIADYSIHLGQFDAGVCTSGYVRDYRYDPRLFYMPPPFFPTTGRYLVCSWEEVNPPEA
jgi:hypothetical protein